MSRIGKKPVKIPEGVTVEVNNNLVMVKGPKGELKNEFKEYVKISKKDQDIIVEPVIDKKNQLAIRAYWGLARKLIQNSIDGVSKGFEKKLTIEGIGYKAQIQGNKLVMALGYSHPVEMPIPQGLKVTVTDNINIVINGFDCYQVGQYAALVRKQRSPEPYKGKGVRYFNEHIKRKVGKSGV